MGQETTDLLGTGLIHPFARGGDVPASRLLISDNEILTINGGTQADLTADVHFDIDCISEGGLVGSDLLLIGTDPVRINGGASHDHSSDLTISVNVFAGTTPGLVPLGTSDPGLFLSQAGWAAGAVVGVASITGTAPMVVSPTTGAAVVSISPANLTTPGHVPAVGAVNTAQALIRTNPPSWGTVGLTGFVQLQPTYPGTAQAGSAHIDGVFGAQSAVVAGSNKKSKNGTGLENLYVKQNGAVNHPVIATYQAISAPSAGLIFRTALGTEVTPLGTTTGMQLLRLIHEGWVPGAPGGYSQTEILSVQQNGTISTHIPLEVMLRSQGSTGPANSSYLYLGPNALAGLGTVTPLSGFEVGTSFGLATRTVTGTTPSVVSTYDLDCMYFCDATASASTLQLVTTGNPGGRRGRIHGFMKIDATSKPIQIQAAGGALIAGNTSHALHRRGDCVILQSDGTNWQILAQSKQLERFVSAADGTAVANTVVETNLYDMANPDLSIPDPGLIGHLYGYGKFSTTGTPTCRFRIRNGTGELLVDSGAITMPAGLTDAVWQMEYTGTCRNHLNNAPRWPVARIFIAQAAGIGAEMKCYSMVDLAIVGAGFVTGMIPRRLTAEWGTASASNTITCLSMVRAQTDSTTLV